MILKAIPLGYTQRPLSRETSFNHWEKDMCRSRHPLQYTQSSREHDLIIAYAANMKLFPSVAIDWMEQGVEEKSFSCGMTLKISFSFCWQNEGLSWGLAFTNTPSPSPFMYQRPLSKTGNAFIFC